MLHLIPTLELSQLDTHNLTTYNKFQQIILTLHKQNNSFFYLQLLHIHLLLLVLIIKRLDLNFYALNR
jgi:hypothetical protein